MITKTYQPHTLQEALRYLQNSQTYPLGGGTTLNARKNQDFSLVSLANLGLDHITAQGEEVSFGAMVTLSALLEQPDLPEALKQAVTQQAPPRIRRQATLGGLIAAGSGQSPLLTALLALDAEVTLSTLDETGATQESTLRIGNLLPLRTDYLAQALITGLRLSLRPQLAFEYASRASGENFLYVAIARWPSGRTRVTAGGWGKTPALAMDGKDSLAAATALRNICHEAHDQRATAAERMDAAVRLAERCLASLQNK